MGRVSLRALMSFVLVFAVVSAVVLAAFKNPSDGWIQSLIVAPVFALAATVLGCMLLRGRRRAWCVGFACFGIVYLALTADYQPGATIRPHLATTYLLEFAQAELVSSPLVLEWFQAIVSDGLTHPPQGPSNFRQKTKGINYRRFLRSAAYNDHFQRVGHRLFVLLFGVVGGTIASWLYSRQERKRESSST
jgi:hypothetical protein